MINKIKQTLKNNFVFIITMIICFFVFSYEFPYYVMAPGGAIDISNRVEIADSEQDDGSLNILYVSNYKGTLPFLLLSKVFSNWDIEAKAESQISDETPQEVALRNKYLLDNSISNAILLAYDHAGKEYTVTDTKNVIIGLTKENQSNLKIGDIILSVEGILVENINTIRSIIREATKETLTFSILRDQQTIDIDVKINENETTKNVGVIMITNNEYKLNPDIKLKFKKTESGSSGGLMLALSIYNKISDIDLIKGRKIAGTGTIDIDGNVGEIDGVKYKLIGAIKDGIDIMMVPKENYDECIKLKQKYNYKITIVKIETLEEAITYLKET